MSPTAREERVCDVLAEIVELDDVLRDRSPALPA